MRCLIPTSDSLLKPREAAAELGLSYPTIKQWILSGKLASVKTPGGHNLIARSSLAPFLKSTTGRKEKRERFSEGQRPKPVDWNDRRDQDRRPAGEGRSLDRRPVHHVDHHCRCGARDAASQRPDCRGADEIDRSDDCAGLRIPACGIPGILKTCVLGSQLRPDRRCALRRWCSAPGRA